MGTRNSSPMEKVAVVEQWPLASSQYQGQESVEIYLHFPICLHGIVHNLQPTGNYMYHPL